jgi:hypothetical protein
MARRSDAGFKVIVALTDKFTAPIREINKSIQQSTAKMRGMMAIPGAIAREAGFGKIGTALGNVGKQFGNLRSSVAGLIGPFLRIGGIIGGFSLGKLVTDAVGAGAELIKLNKQTGVSVEGLQRLQYAATQSGLSADDMGGALTKLNKTIAAGRKGDKETVKVFNALGISMKELKGLNTEETFLRVATAVSNMSDPIHKSESAMKIFGKTGAELIALLNEGGVGIRALGKELESTGAVMDLQTALSAKEFGDIMTVVGHQIKGMAYTILSELLPSMKGSATGMKDWISANKDWIKVEVVATIQNIVAAGKALVNIIRNDVVPVVKSMKPVWDALVAVIGKGNAVLLAFTAVVAPGIIGSLFGIGKALLALGATLLANPIAAAIIALVAGFAFLAYSVWKNWDGIKEAFTEGVDTTVKTIDRLGAGFAELGRVATDEWFQVKWSDITAELSKGWDMVTATWRVLAGNLAQVGREAWASLVESVGPFVADFGKAIVAGVGRIKDAIVSAFNEPIETVKSLWDGLISFLQITWNTITGGIAAAAGAVRDAIVGAFNSPIETVKRLWEGLISFLQGAWNTITGIFGRKIEAPQVAAPQIDTSKLTGDWAKAAETIASKPLVAATDKVTDATAGKLGGAWAGAGAGKLGGAWGGVAEAKAGTPTAAAMPAAAAGVQASKAEIDVKFQNAPAGMQVTQRSSGPADVSIEKQYAGPRGSLAMAH